MPSSGNPGLGGSQGRPAGSFLHYQGSEAFDKARVRDRSQEGANETGLPGPPVCGT